MSESSKHMQREHKKFTMVEDNLLQRLVRQYGACNWGMIANFMSGRTSRQCRERWKYYLSVPVKNGDWTEVEDELLLQKYDEIGPHWVEMTNYFHSRTDINLKNRFNRLRRIMKRSATATASDSFQSSPSAQSDSEVDLVQAVANTRRIISLPTPLAALMSIKC